MPGATEGPEVPSWRAPARARSRAPRAGSDPMGALGALQAGRGPRGDAATRALAAARAAREAIGRW